MGFALVGLAALVAVGERGGIAGAQSSQSRPNIVVVMTDDQRPGTLRFMPNVRALGGTIYRRSYVVQPLCCPSRMSYITGLNPSNHGVTSNFPASDIGVERIHELESQGLATWLEEAGYTTGFTGRYLNGYLDWAPPYVPAGWDEWHGRGSKGFRATDVEHFDGENLIVPGGHDTRVNEDWATSFINRHAGDDPFFLSVLPLAPHTATHGDRPGRRHLPVPLDEHRGTITDVLAPGRAGRIENMSDKAPLLQRLPRVGQTRANVYWRRKIEALIGVDEMVGRIRAELEAAGEWENTVLIFTSDNGFQLGEHRLWGKDLPYQETARVPLVVSGSGFEAGRDNRIVANVDLPLTIAHLAGAEPTLPPDGLPLWGKARRHLVMGGSHQGKRPWTSIVNRRYAFIRWKKSGRELYNLNRDPRQLRAIAGRRALKQRLARTMREAG